MKFVWISGRSRTWGHCGRQHSCRLTFTKLSGINKTCNFSFILRSIVDAPRYVTNDMIHKDLGIPTVHEVIHDRSTKHRTKLESHSNPLLQLLPRDIIRRLKRLWPTDLSYGERDLLAGGKLITIVCLQVRLPAGLSACRILCTLIAD